MDQFAIDLGPDGGGVAEADRAVLFGTGACGAPTALDWARLCGTIDYEILTGVRGRRIRRYVKAPAPAGSRAGTARSFEDPGEEADR